MTQAQTDSYWDAELAFKRHILRESRAFASEPQADLYRVNLLGQMLNRYDELLETGISCAHAQARVLREFDRIPDQMRDMGFEETAQDEPYTMSRWPQMTENEAAQYIKERDVYLHKHALGVAMCASCVFPLMVSATTAELTISWKAVEAITLVGLMGMFAMIALGVYSMTQAKKPKKEDVVKKGRFSLSSRLYKKLEALREAMEEKARRRRGRGIALLIGCVAPVLLGGAMDSLFLSSSASLFAMLGVAGMCVWSGAGVYELVMAGGEKKTMKKLLDKKK